MICKKLKNCKIKSIYKLRKLKMDSYSAWRQNKNKYVYNLPSEYFNSDGFLT